MKDPEAEEMARRLDLAYQKFIGARARVKNEILIFLRLTAEMAKEVQMVKGAVRGSFVRWCRIHCRVFLPGDGRAAIVVAERITVEENWRIETWQLRLLKIISPIHHAVRPMAAKRKAKPGSWIGAIASTREKVNKMIEQAGGADGIDSATRTAISRQLAVFDELRTKLK
jgi:hypothetical protein